MASMPGLRARQIVCVTVGCLMFASDAWAQSAPRPLLATQVSLSGQSKPAGQFVDRVYRDADGDHKYVVFIPAGHTPAKGWPVILYLHGASCRGTDGRAQLVSGLASAVKLKMATFPFLIVFPQCENTQSRLQGGWSDEPTEADRALRILDTVEREDSIDKSREILAGLSMGGTGVWELAARTPDRWAALVPVSAVGRPEQAAKIAKIPAWTFHAVSDPLVPLSVPRDMVAAIRAAGGRAFLSEVPARSHDISHLTLTQQAVQDWMLDPSKEPQVDLEWKQPAGYSNGMEQEVPFVAGAEISHALRLRVCNDILESHAYALPQTLSTSGAMSGHLPGVQQSAKVGFLPYDVSLSGLHFQGHVEQARLVTQAPDRLLVQLGLRNVTATVSNTQINGRLLFSASVGPMNVVIGHRAPVWLSVVIRPRVENRRLKLDVVGADFQIQSDNWYVTEPAGVHVRGMPFLNGRVADGMVDGVYSRKGEIERQVVAGVPRMVQQIEAKLDEQFHKIVSFGQLPMPIWQMRLRYWPEQVAIDEHGITLAVGATMSALGHPTKDFKMRKYAPPSEQLTLVKTGTEVAASPQLIAAWAELIVAGRVNSFNACDFARESFRKLANREFLQEAIPDLKRYGEDLETNTDMVVMKPVQLRAAQAPVKLTPESKVAAENCFSVLVPQIRLAISIRRPGELKWTPCVNVDLRVHRDYEPQLLSSGFAARAVRAGVVSDLNFEPTAQFAPGYEPQNKEIDLPRIVSQIMAAREEEQRDEGNKPRPSNDILVGGVPWRLEEFGWSSGHLVFRHRVPPIRLRNDGEEPLTYEVRGPLSDWSPPRTLAPGEHHEFTVPYPLTWRRRLPTTTLFYTLPLGREASSRDTPTPGLVLVKDEIEFTEKDEAPQSAKLDGSSPISQ